MKQAQQQQTLTLDDIITGFPSFKFYRKDTESIEAGDHLDYWVTIQHHRYLPEGTQWSIIVTQKDNGFNSRQQIESQTNQDFIIQSLINLYYLGF